MLRYLKWLSIETICTNAYVSFEALECRLHKWIEHEIPWIASERKKDLQEFASMEIRRLWSSLGYQPNIVDVSFNWATNTWH
jgi:hypothetical protein